MNRSPWVSHTTGPVWLERDIYFRLAVRFNYGSVA
jgi:hypothetical protein